LIDGIKSTAGTAEANLAEIERVQTLADQIRILNDQYAMQVAANESRLQALQRQIQALRNE
jgi:polyhydroxyalkanoate synthesis regulator phasin